MSGDGVNEVPALDTVDVGIAMGAAGTDVARQGAGVVLEDDRPESLVVAVARGTPFRTTFARRCTSCFRPT